MSVKPKDSLKILRAELAPKLAQLDASLARVATLEAQIAESTSAIRGLERDVVAFAGVKPWAPFREEDTRRYRVGDVREDGATKLADGTWQFPNAPQGTHPDGSTINVVPNTTPEVGPEWGIGATFRRKDVPSDPPYTVVRVLGAMVLGISNRTDGQPQQLEALPSQLELITRAPAS